MRERLRRSTRPDRIFEVGLQAAQAAGLLGRRRVLDSTPLYDAVATMDTVTLIRSALRGLLAAADAHHDNPGLRVELRAVLGSGDDYTAPGKPQIDWDDPAAREQLIDSRGRDGLAVLALLDGRGVDELGEWVRQAAALLATVLGQDLESGEDGVFRIARRVAADRVISTVDPDTRHGHKTAARGFDGYKGPGAVDPDSEIITATAVTPGNTGDAAVADDLITDLTVTGAPATPPKTPPKTPPTTRPPTTRPPTTRPPTTRPGRTPPGTRQAAPKEAAPKEAAPSRRRCTAITPTARGVSTITCASPGSRRDARPRRRTRPAGGSARTASRSI